MSDRTLGRYRLTAAAPPPPGVVEPAEDTLLERRVDLLLVPEAAVADPARSARIRHEVERATAFVHPNAATVYGMEEEGGRLFVTLEPAGGRSLGSLLDTGRLPLATALEIALVMVDVLAGAKEAGVVHGGLHPGDIRLGEDGTIAVGGFGQHELRLAAAAETGGPPPGAAFQPPETAPGLLPDHRADLFALGRMVEVMLAAGEAGSEGERGLPQGPLDGLRAELGRCLAEDPAQRPQSASELRPALERLQRELLREPEPEPAPGQSVGGRLPRGRPLWALLAAAALLAALAGWAIWRVAGRAEPTGDPPTAAEPAAAVVDLIDLAVMPFTAGADPTPTEVRLALGFGGEIARLLERNRRVSVIAPGSAARAAAGGTGATKIADRLGAAHLLEGGFLWQRDAEISRAEATVRLTRASDGEVLWQETLEGFFGEAATLQDRVATAAARRLGAGGRPGAPLTLSPGAYAAYLEGVGRNAGAGAEDDLRAATADLERAVTLDPGLLPAHTRLARWRLRLGDADAATGALAAARRIDPDDPELRWVAAELGLASGGDPAVALKELEAALEGLPGHPGLLHAAAAIDRRQGRWDEALERLTAARKRNPLDLELGVDLVQTLAWKRRFVEAAEVADRLAAALPEAAEPGLLRADLLLAERGDAARARSLLEGLGDAARAAPGWRRRMLRLDLYEGEYKSALARLDGLRLEETERLIERAWIHRHMGRARRAANDFERARDLLDDRLEAAPGDPALSSLLAQAYAGTGGAHLASRMGQRSVTQLPVTTDAVAGVELVERLARTYVLAGDHEHALDELAFLLEIPSPVTVATLRLDPVWEPLRGEARFQELLERFGP